MLPSKFSSAFPIPTKKGYNYKVISKVASFATISSAAPYQLIAAGKSIIYPIDVGAYKNSTTTFECVALNEATQEFRMDECIKSVTNESVECQCNTINNKICVLLANNISDKSTVKLICGVVIPIVVLIIAVPSGIILGLRRVKINAHKKKIVDSRSIDNPKTGTNELTA